MTTDAATILIVEDEPPIRRLLRATLGAHDHRTLEAATGAEALSAMRHHRADLVRRLVRRGPEDVRLSPKEYDILEQLVIHAGKVLTHKHLLREVWRDESVDPQYLRVYVRQLRQKIEADPSTPRHVLTEPGIGYRLV